MLSIPKSAPTAPDAPGPLRTEQPRHCLVKDRVPIHDLQIFLCSSFTCLLHRALLWHLNGTQWRNCVYVYKKMQNKMKNCSYLFKMHLKCAISSASCGVLWNKHDKPLNAPTENAQRRVKLLRVLQNIFIIYNMCYKYVLYSNIFNMF